MSKPLDTENTRKEAVDLITQRLEERKQPQKERNKSKVLSLFPYMRRLNPTNKSVLRNNTRKNTNISYSVGSPSSYHIGDESTGVNPKNLRNYLNKTEIKRIKYILLHDISKLFQEKKDEFIRSINEDDFTEDVSVDYNLDIKMRSFITTQLQQKYNYSAEFIYCIINTCYVKEQHAFEPINDNEYTKSNPCKKTVNIFNFEDDKGKITGVLDLKPEKHSDEDTELHLLHLALLRQVRDIRTKFSSKILPPMMKSNNSSPTDNNSSPRDVESGIRQLFEKYDEELDKKTKELQKKMDGSNRDLSKYIANIEKAEEKEG